MFYGNGRFPLAEPGHETGISSNGAAAIRGYKTEGRSFPNSSAVLLTVRFTSISSQTKPKCPRKETPNPKLMPWVELFVNTVRHFHFILSFVSLQSAAKDAKKEEVKPAADKKDKKK
jgi:hypothetical protein